ncbi:uncharacterized protein A4U43_C07F18040 [Asparagus officinalis]|uniref:RNA helicase n=1 Tax=Asparagus officinalis TaxID=4686 RepID=A0A5P1ECU1_ASPOF|nr:uncharacterized protein A4U43_C07F18040 [Asparagus officinalis]
MGCLCGMNPLLMVIPRRNPNNSLLLLSSYTDRDISFASCRSKRASFAASSSSVSMAEAPPASCSPTLRDICRGKVPEHIIKRAEEIGYVVPTDVQQQSLPVLLSGRDCVLHAQTGSGKTLAYLLSVFSATNIQRSAVQALIVVPNRELGMQVTKVARMLSAKPVGFEFTQKTCTVMALLDGGMLKRHKSWLKAEPPEIVVATIASLTQMIEKNVFKLDTLRVLVIDEVDFIFSSSKQVYSLRKLLTSYSTIHTRQTVFASASIPQHNRFLYDCVQQKWTKNDVVHIHVNPIEPMPSRLSHNFVVCNKKERLHILLSLLQRDAPKSGIIFVGVQSEKSKKAGKPPSTTLVIEYLRESYNGGLEALLLEENMNFNARATSLSLATL